MPKRIKSAPTIVYPESDGKPMAETETHRDLMIDFIQMLKHHFGNVDDVCVSGNMFVYYEEGNTRKSVAPDVFVAFGVGKKERRTYRIWEEGHAPDFVLEVASPKTFRDDLTKKKDLYANELHVKEYFIYDPLGEIVPSFVGYRLNNGVYQEIPFAHDRLASEVLGLELGENDGILRLFDPAKSEWLPTATERAENAEAHVESAEARAESAEARAENAEARIEQLLAEIDKLKSQNKS